MADECKRCGQTIFFGLDAKRRRVPLEAHARGDLILLPPAPGQADPEIAPATEGVRTLRFRRHSEGCPKAGRR